MVQNPTFSWLNREFQGVCRFGFAISEGKYMDRAELRLIDAALRSSRAQVLLLKLTQADGWLVERVDWRHFESDLGLRGVTLVRHHDRHATV